MKECYICPHCGSSYVRLDGQKIKCTQCRKEVSMSINSGEWIKRERKVVRPEHPEEKEKEKAVKNPEQRLREIPEVETK